MEQQGRVILEGNIDNWQSEIFGSAHDKAPLYAFVR